MQHLVAYVHLCMQIFKVELVDEPEDIAYTEIAIPYHVDVSGWKESPPGLSILHCLQSVNHIICMYYLNQG